MRNPISTKKPHHHERDEEEQEEVQPIRRRTGEEEEAEVADEDILDEDDDDDRRDDLEDDAEDHTMAMLDEDVADGSEVVLIWGEENGGSPRPIVERHVQTEVRTTVSYKRLNEDS